jgi:AcrR family transcriptional regulator
MTPRKPGRDRVSRDEWAAQVAALSNPPPAPAPRREPLTADRIVDAALTVVAAEGFDALSMRRVAGLLQASPGALYAHVRDKAELDDLMIGRLAAAVSVPVPDPARWREQALDVFRQLRDQYLRYPGISRAALTAAPRSLDTLRLNEGVLAILMAGGVSAMLAAWAADAAYLYVGAYSGMALRRHTTGDAEEEALDRDEAIERLRMLPADRFPITVTYAADLVSGEGHDRFDFTLGLLLSGLVRPGDR